ncbi:GNAT family N-acetyltransferase [Pedosphaera parvula]|nr:GNAT family N-acetyltransferase [Pedosphaera parvula]
MNHSLRLCRETDIPALEELIPLSVRTLQSPCYSVSQMEAALGPVFGVDRQLILDQTYFIVEEQGRVVGCGGWSRRKTLFGSDEGRSEAQNPLLNPLQDAARIRAFFVHPDFARRGIGRALLFACEKACIQAGFQRAELVATLAGEPLYTNYGYAEFERYSIPLAHGLSLPVVRMRKVFLL